MVNTAFDLPKKDRLVRVCVLAAKQETIGLSIEEEFELAALQCARKACGEIVLGENGEYRLPADTN